MDQRSQRRKESSRWWRREKAYRYLRPAACDLVSMGCAHRPGNDQCGEQCKFSRKILDDTYVTDRPIGENSFPLELNRNLSKTYKGKPMKVVEEMQNDKETRHPSPSVIARLMGLDALPPQIVHDKQSGMHKYFQKTSGLQDKHAFHDYCSSGKVRNECQEFKDVFEIMETSKVEKNSGKRLSKGMETSEGSDTNGELFRQNFTDVENFSNNETIDDSEASNETSEFLDHDNAFAMKFFEEPNSLFLNHFQDVKRLSTHPSDVTVLKPSMSTKLKGFELKNTSGRRAEKCTLVQNNRPTQKPASSPGNFSQKEHNLFYSDKMLKSQYANKMGACINPTQIVILKPNLEEAEKSDDPFDNFIAHDRGHGEFRGCRAKNLNAEGRDWPKFNLVGTTENKAKGSSEMARNISKAMGNDASRDIERILASRFNKYISSDSIDYMSQMTQRKNYKAAQRSLNDFTDQYKRRNKTVSELSVNREGRRRLSQRWKTSHQFGDMALSDRGSNTLAEMLSLSDKELLKKITDSSITRKISGERLARDGMLAERSCYSATSNWDTSKNDCNFPISTHPASSFIGLRNTGVSRRGKPGAYDNYSTLNNVLSLGTYSSVDENLCQRGRFTRRKSKCCSNVPCSCTSVKPAYKLASRDDYVHSEFSNKFKMRTLHEENSRLHDDTISHKDQLLDDRDANLHLVNHEDQESCNKLESGSPVRLKELEHPSPVSVLEQPASEGENYTLGCFDGVNVDLQGLRTQLQLLKLESEDIDFSESGTLDLGNDDTGGVHRSPIEELRGMLEELKDAEDREFSYLVDVLIDSGIGCANWDRIFDACYTPEYPVCPDVFEKLEKKYGVIVEWSSSERKLLFDLINVVLTEILAPCMDLHPWVKSKKKFSPMCARERLVEETWLMIARLRKELSRGNPEDKVLDLMWFDIGDDIDLIGREIEGLIKEELLQELVTDFI